MQKPHMEVANFWLPIIGSGIFLTIGITAWYADHNVAGIWSSFACLVCLLLLVALQLQHGLTQQEDKISPAVTLDQVTRCFGILLRITLVQRDSELRPGTNGQGEQHCE